MFIPWIRKHISKSYTQKSQEADCKCGCKENQDELWLSDRFEWPETAPFAVARESMAGTVVATVAGLDWTGWSQNPQTLVQEVHVNMWIYVNPNPKKVQRKMSTISFPL